MIKLMENFLGFVEEDLDDNVDGEEKKKLRRGKLAGIYILGSLR